MFFVVANVEINMFLSKFSRPFRLGDIIYSYICGGYNNDTRQKLYKLYKMDKQKGWSYTKPLLTVLLFCVIQALSGIMVALFTKFQGGGFSFDTQISVTLLVSNVVSILAAWKLLGVVRMKGQWQCKNLSWRSGTLAVMGAALGIFATDLFAEMLDLPNIIEATMAGLASNALGILALAVVGPVTEEIIFREAVLGSMLRSGVSPWRAMAFSALCFGIIHFNPAQIPFACVVGFILAYIYYKTESIVLTSIVHIINNSVACIEMNVLGERAATFSYTDLLGGPVAVTFIMAVCACLSFFLLRKSW